MTQNIGVPGRIDVLSDMPLVDLLRMGAEAKGTLERIDSLLKRSVQSHLTSVIGRSSEGDWNLQGASFKLVDGNLHVERVMLYQYGQGVSTLGGKALVDLLREKEVAFEAEDAHVNFVLPGIEGFPMVNVPAGGDSDIDFGQVDVAGRIEDVLDDSGFERGYD